MNEQEQSGRERLLQAAISLAAEKRSLADVGVRELTRAAGLSPGAFYRHFRNTEELGTEVVAMVADILQRSLHPLWASMRDRRDVLQMSLQRYFRVALDNEAAFIVCARERYGASATLRLAMRELQIGLARDMARELAQSRLLAALPLVRLEAAALAVIEHLNIYWLDYAVAEAAERQRIQSTAEDFVQRHFSGIMAPQRQEASA